MAILTAAEIDEMHAVYVDAMVSTCVITNPGTAVSTTSPCAVIKRQRQSMAGGASSPIDRQIDDTVCLPLGTDVSPGFTIVADGVRYMAGEVVQPATTYDHGIFVEVTREAVA